MVWNGGERCGVHANRRAANKSALSHSHQTISSHLNPTTHNLGRKRGKKTSFRMFGKEYFHLTLMFRKLPFATNLEIIH